MPTKPLNAIVISGALALAVAAPAAPAAPLLSSAHPVHASVATCNVTMPVKFTRTGGFHARADSASCAGVVLGNAITPRAIAFVTGRAVRGGMCGWAVRSGRLTLSVAALNRGFGIAVPFRMDRASAAGPLSGSASVGREAVAYTGVWSLAPHPSSSKSPPCHRAANGPGRLSFELALSSPAAMSQS